MAQIISAINSRAAAAATLVTNGRDDSQQSMFVRSILVCCYCRRLGGCCFDPIRSELSRLPPSATDESERAIERQPGVISGEICVCDIRTLIGVGQWTLSLTLRPFAPLRCPELIFR